MIIKCSVDSRKRQYKAKPKGVEYSIIQTNVKEIEIPLTSLVNDTILKGISFKCAVVKGMKDDDFICQQLFCIDIDNDDENHDMQTIDDVELIARNNNLEICFSYYTFSHTPEKPKFRVAFFSDTIVTSKEEVELVNKYLISLFNQADKVTYNASRLYLGTNKQLAKPLKIATFNYNNILNLAKELDNKAKEEAKLKQNTYNKAIYNNSYSSDFDDLVVKIKDFSINYMSQYTTKQGYNCCSCSSGTGRNKTGITFVPNTSNTILKCFACNWSGDIIHYHRTLNNLEYIDSIKELASMFNIEFDFNHNKNQIIQSIKEVEEDDDVISESRYDTASTNNKNIIVGKSLVADGEVQRDKKEIELEEKCKKLDRKTKESRFNEIICQVAFKPNRSITFIRDTVIKIKTGGGKTYNLIQLCLDKIINKTSKKIIIMTSSNDLVNDFVEKLALAIREIIAEYSSYFSFEDLDNILKYANILKLNIDTEKIEDFSIFDIVVTNQAYLYSRGDTLKNSKKFDKLAELVNNNVDLYDLYIDEIHVLEQYKYSVINLSQLVKSNENNSLNREYQKVNNYYIPIDGHFMSADISYSIALMEHDLNIFRYKYNDNGLVNTKILLDNITIHDETILNQSCLKIIDNRYSLVAVTKLVNFTINTNLNNLSSSKAQVEFNNFINWSADKFIIENNLAIVDNTTKMTIEFDSHLSFYDFAISKFDYNTIVVDMMKIINNNLVKNNKALFNKLLFIEKKRIKLNCNHFYCTATIDNIAKQYNIVKQETNNQACKINKINVLFCSIDLLTRLKGKASLSIVNLDARLKQATNIILSEKYKVLDLKKKIDQIQAENLTRTVIHYEKDTKTLVDDTKVNSTISELKISYMQETRQVGTDFSDTALILLDCKRTVNANEKYNRYISKDNKVVTIFKSDTQIIFDHCKQTIGRVLRGEIEEKTIVVCLPDPIINNNNVESMDKLDNIFDTVEYIKLFKAYFKEEFGQIDMNYTDYTNIKNKTQAVKKVAEYIGIHEKVKTEKQEIRKTRDDLIKERYQELVKDKNNLSENTIISLLVDEFDIKKSIIYKILDIKQLKEDDETAVIEFIKDALAMNVKKAEIIKYLDENFNIKKSKAYELFRRLK